VEVRLMEEIVSRDNMMAAYHRVIIARQSGWEARDNQDGESVSRRDDDCRVDCRAQEFFEL
jgi:hypothetical protein